MLGVAKKLVKYVVCLSKIKLILSLQSVQTTKQLVLGLKFFEGLIL
jgi:hypothetical protein